MFENRVLRRISGPKTDEVTGGWRKLPREEFKNWHCSLNIIRMKKSRKMRWTGHVARMGEEKNAYRTGKHRRRWEDNNKMDLREIG
jgi:hypothetical protein